MTTDDVFDQTASLDAVQREMGRREIPAGNARTAVLRRTYRAPIADVWDAITSPDRLSRFFLPLAGDLREGGHYALEGNASGEILVCSPPELLRLQWTPPDDRGYSDEVEVRLRADGPESTVLELEHASVGDVFHTDPDTGCWGVGIGWEPPLHFLAHHLAGRLPDAPATEWFTFDEAAELRYAELRGREWAPIEAAQADGSHPAA